MIYVILVVTSLMPVAGLWVNSVSAVPMSSDGRTVAWFHVPKCGTSFGTTLAHYANSSIPLEARIPDARDPKCGNFEGRCFLKEYPIDQYFNGLLWEKKGKW